MGCDIKKLEEGNENKFINKELLKICEKYPVEKC